MARGLLAFLLRHGATPEVILTDVGELAGLVVVSKIPSQPGGTMSDIQEMEMPAVCARCDEWFELNDMYGSDVESDSGSRLECLSCHQKASHD